MQRAAALYAKGNLILSQTSVATQEKGLNMSKTYFPFNAILQGGIPDRSANAEIFAAYLQNFFTNGVILKASTSLQVYAGTGMQIQVRPGIGFINGRIFISDATENLVIETAAATLSRIDRVVLRLDLVNRLIDLAILKGTPASDPAAPGLTRNDEVYELCLAEVYVGSAVATLSQSNITDTRSNTAVCGIVAAAIKQIDTSTFYAQFEAQFNAWFETVRDQAATETLAGMQASLQALRETVTSHISDTGSHIKSLGLTSGTLAAYTLAAEGMTVKDYDNIMAVFHGENLDGATLAVNDVVGTLYKTDGTAVKAGDIKADVPYLLTYLSGKYFFKSGGGSLRFAAGDEQLYKDTDYYSVTESTETRMKAVKLYASGSVRVKAAVYCDTYSELYLRKNGETIVTYKPESGTNEQYSYDIDISSGDEIAFWGKTNGNFGKFLRIDSFEIGTDHGLIYEKIF